MTQLRFFRSHGRIKKQNASGFLSRLIQSPGLPLGQIKLTRKYEPVRMTVRQSFLMGSPISFAIWWISDSSCLHRGSLDSASFGGDGLLINK